MSISVSLPQQLHHVMIHAQAPTEGKSKFGSSLGRLLLNVGQQHLRKEPARCKNAISLKSIEPHVCCPIWSFQMLSKLVDSESVARCAASHSLWDLLHLAQGSRHECQLHRTISKLSCQPHRASIDPTSTPK
eukprot:4916290-Amphidinium_carterae.1